MCINHIIRRLLSPIMVLALLACTPSGTHSIKSRPVWIDSPSKTYSKTHYLSAVGQASDYEAAGDRALANLSKFFEVSVEDNAVDFTEAKIKTQAQLRTVKNEQRATRYVTAFAQEVLEGANVSQHWQDRKGQHYAIAVMEKSVAAQRFKDELMRCNEHADAAIKLSHSAANVVVKLSALEKARLQQYECLKHHRNLVLVDGQAPQPDYSTSQLEEQIRQLLRKQAVNVISENKDLEKEVKSALSILGVKQSSRASLSVNAKLDLDSISKNQGWYWQKGSIVMELLQESKTLSTQRWPLKVSATDQKQVTQRLRQTLSQKSSPYLYELLTRGASSSR